MSTRWSTLLAVSLAVSTVALPAAAQGSGFDQRAFQGELAAMNAGLSAGGRAPARIIADAQRLGSTYRSMLPAARSFSATDQTLNQQLAAQSFQWLSRASLMYRTDPAVQAALMAAYGSIGSFYRDAGAFYAGGAFTAFGGACQMARLLVLGAGSERFEQDLQRYALAYATAAYAYGRVFDWWVSPLGQQGPKVVAPGQPPAAPAPAVLPPVDEAALTAEQREQWRDVQDRFRATAPRVHEARIRMNELTARLSQQRLTVNVTDAATASNMQGFLDDAVELIKAGDFALASQALVRASYERAKLKNVIGS